MGPNWVHGTQNNPIIQLAADTKTNIRNFGEVARVYRPSGEAVDGDTVEKLDDLIWNIISDAYAYSNKSCADINPELSLRDFFQMKLPEHGLSKEDEDIVMKMGEMWGSLMGGNWDEQSLKWFWLEECLDGANLYVVDSHKRILDRMAKKLWQNADIQLEVRVTRIESIRLRDEDPRVSVTVQSNAQERTLVFHEVVVAVPLGCLKRNSITFIPPLPSEISTGIENASISNLEKVYMSFPKAFWDQEQSLNGAEKQSPTGAQNESGEYFPGFANFLRPTCGFESRRRFSLEINTLSNPKIFGPNARPMLLFILFGDSARQLTSLINDLSLSSPEYYTTITNFLKPYYSLLPHHNEIDSNCIPKSVLATNWQNDDLAGYGSYTNFKVHESGKHVQLDEEVWAMRRGMPERGIWLAGEHTAPLVGLGTSTGAMWSGEIHAVRVLAMNGLMDRRGKGHYER